MEIYFFVFLITLVLVFCGALFLSVLIYNF